MECPFGHSRFLERARVRLRENKREEERDCDLLHEIKSLSDQEEEGRRKKRKEDI